MTDLKKLRELAENATPGPWYAIDPDTKYYIFQHNDWNDDGWTVSNNIKYQGWNTDSGCEGYGISKANAQYIAAANPQTILKLLNVLEAAIKMNKEIYEQCSFGYECQEPFNKALKALYE